MKTLLLTLFGLSMSISNAHATVSCEADTWLDEPKVTSGMFTATIGSICTVISEGGGGLAQIDRHLIAETVKEEVLGGPFDETYQELPSILYDIRSTRTIQSVFGTDTVTVRSDAHIATDGATQVIQEGLSKEISGTGIFDNMRKLDYGVRVFPVSGDGGVGSVYRIEVWNTLHVKKPSLVPSGYFRDKVAEAMQTEFRKSRDTRLAAFPANL